MTRMERSGQGFTIVELLVVILIIGILAAILIPSLVSATCQSRATVAQNMIKNIENKIVQYRKDKGRFPPETSEAGSEPIYKALSVKKGRGTVYHEFEKDYVRAKGEDEEKKVYSNFAKNSGYKKAFEIHYALPRGEDYEEMWHYNEEHPSPEKFNLYNVNLWTAGCNYKSDDKETLYEINNFE